MVAVRCPECGRESEFHNDGKDEYYACEHVLRSGDGDDRHPSEVYGTPEHEAWLIEMEEREP